jgi:hypothetical protein
MRKLLMESHSKCGNCDKQAAIWFEKGQLSIKRKNKSGCTCIIDEDDGDRIVSVCGAHQNWLEEMKEVEEV